MNEANLLAGMAVLIGVFGTTITLLVIGYINSDRIESFIKDYAKKHHSKT